MLKHKSFVIKSAKKPKARVLSMNTEMGNALEPKMAINHNDDQAPGHYDNNEEITLVLPQSLSLEEETLNTRNGTQGHENSGNKNDHISQTYSIDEEAVTEENDEIYSDANTYFEKENNVVKEQTIQSKVTEEKPNVKQKEEPVDEEMRTHDAVVIDSNEILEDDAIREQDKKFEEDLKSILSGKKQFDKERIEKNPEEAVKGKNHGVFNKKDDQAIEDKLKNDHAIFDKIAQSMEMASSYDLGAIAMDKKFDNLEKETDQDFTKKIHDLIGEEKQKKEAVIEEAAHVDENSAQKVEEEDQALKGNDKVDTKDFLSDLDSLNTIEANHKKEVLDTLATQSSFDSTISIKQRNLKSRVFAVSGSAVEVMVNSHWIPLGCSPLIDLNVTLTRSIDYWPDDDISTKQFRIGGPDTKTWNDLKTGNYYLTFFFVNNTNPNCELSGTIKVKA